MNKAEKTRFGIKLRELRKAGNYTIEELANECNYTYEYFRQIETGHRAPSLSLVLSLCNVLNTSPNYLLEISEPKNNISNQILDKVNRLTPKDQELALDILELYIEKRYES